MTANSNDAMTPEAWWGVRVVLYPDVGDPVPPNDIPGLLASDPDRGLFELQRATFDPSMPSKTIRKILTDAFDDARITPDTRAELLWRYNRVPCFRDAVLADCKGDIPFFLLDSEKGREWYCECELPGYETIRCSSPVFYSDIQVRACYDWREDEKDFDPFVLDAMRSETPARLMMTLAVAGRRVDSRLLCSLLRERKMRILDWLMENDEYTNRWLDPHRLLFYACANWPLPELADFAEESERRHPGIVASCVDTFGRNLIWYASEYRKYEPRGYRMKVAAAVLARLGADPDAPTKWGVSWRQFEHARKLGRWDNEVYLNEALAFWYIPGCGLNTNMSIPQGDEDTHRVRIVHRGTGFVSEWAFPKERFPVLFDASPCDNNGDEISVTFQNFPPDATGNWRDHHRFYAHFYRGPNGLFRLGDVKVD